jgi:hypothetical protein
MEPKKGRKGRKIGKGVRKLSHSKWGKYAALFDYNTMRRKETLARRRCTCCGVQYHSRSACIRHACSKS